MSVSCLNRRALALRVSVEISTLRLIPPLMGFSNIKHQIYKLAIFSCHQLILGWNLICVNSCSLFVSWVWLDPMYNLTILMLWRVSGLFVLLCVLFRIGHKSVFSSCTYYCYVGPLGAFCCEFIVI